MVVVIVWLWCGVVWWWCSVVIISDIGWDGGDEGLMLCRTINNNNK